MIYSVSAQYQYIIINTLVLATCFGLCQPPSGLCLLYGGINHFIEYYLTQQDDCFK
jgi:hypothetical protein